MENESPYTNREIREMQNDIKTQLNRIELQTNKTNGRVLKLENWRSYTAGAVAVILLIGMPVLGFLALQVFNLAKVIK